jgi:hypothetical protein
MYTGSQTTSSTNVKLSDDCNEDGEDRFSDSSSQMCGSEASFALTDDGFESDVIEFPAARADAFEMQPPCLILPQEDHQSSCHATSEACAWASVSKPNSLHGNSDGLQCSVGDDLRQEAVGERVAELKAQAAMLKMFALQAEVAAQQALFEARNVRQRHTDVDSNCIGSALPIPLSSRSKPSSAQSSKSKHQKSREAKSQNTTLMLRRLPQDYTRDSLLNLLDCHGFAGCYDFIYMPADFIKWQSFGYAFVNFVSHFEALRAWEHFHGFLSWTHSDANSEAAVDPAKACEITWGTPLQGLAAHVDRYKNSPVMHQDVPEQCKPLVFSQGMRVQFPAPTKRIRQPRLKYGNPADITLPAGSTNAESNE